VWLERLGKIEKSNDLIGKQTRDLAPCSNVYGNRGISSQKLDFAVDGDEWSDSRPGRFVVRVRALGIHCTGHCMSARTAVNAAEKRKISAPACNRTLIPRFLYSYLVTIGRID
jgi:hypothetical protein